MRKQMLIRVVSVALGAVLFMGCTENKPEGPAERIGRGVDEILGGMRDLGEETSQQERDSWDVRDNRPANQETRPDASASRNERYVPRCDPRFDPKCDDPYWKGRD